MSWRRISTFSFLFLLCYLISCKSDDSSIEENPALNFEHLVTGKFSGAEINEISGIAASYKNKGFYWVHNDSGDLARVFLIDSTGDIKATVTLEHLANRDWEDIASYKDPNSGKSYIYLADIGDNYKQFDLKYIYRIEEPAIDTDKNQEIIIGEVQQLTFSYSAGRKDAETLLVDPLNADIFIISKWENEVDLYTMPSNFNSTDTLVLDKISSLPISIAVGGDISPDGSELIIKTYNKIFYWKRTNQEPINTMLETPGNEVLYTPDFQEEAICWTLNGRNFITIGECPEGQECNINYYRRK